MDKIKFFFGLTVLMIATIAALASAKSQMSPISYYVVGSYGQADEDCILSSSPKNCIGGGPGCIDFIPALGTFQQLYLDATPIPNTDPVRFRCENEMYEQP